MMVRVIVFFAKEHETAMPQTINQCSAVDKFTRRDIPNPPHQGMTLSKGRLPWFAR
jgi:hypothetical protein